MIPIRELRWPDERDLAILHIEPPYKHAGHYLVAALPGRLRQAVRDQSNGRGSALTKAAREAGCEIVCAAISRFESVDRERSIRKRGYLSLLCPVCSKHGVDHENVITRDDRLRERRLLKKYTEDSWQRYLEETNRE